MQIIMRQKQYMYYLHPLHFFYSSTNQQQQNKSKHNMSIFKEGSLNLLLNFFSVHFYTKDHENLSQ